MRHFYYVKFCQHAFMTAPDTLLPFMPGIKMCFVFGNLIWIGKNMLMQSVNA